MTTSASIETKRAQVKQLLNTLAQRGELNASFLLAENGEIVAEGAYGYAELQSKRPLTVSSLFDLASVSKPITALAIVLLKEQGKLLYDDLVATWLPELPYEGITVRHLLQHTSGLPDYMDLFEKHGDHQRIANNADVLEILTSYRPEPLFAPGMQWQYSNTGYVLLAILVERIAGKPFAAFLHEHIFTVAGMSATRICNRRYKPEPIADFAYGYVYDAHAGACILPDEMPETSYVVYLDGIQGDGMIHSNVQDLYRLDRMLHTGKLVSQDALKEAFAPTRLANGETFDYGFGWIREKREDVGTIVSHHGGWPGYSTSFIRYIDANKTLIVLSNMEQDYVYDQQVVAALEHILLGQPYETPKRGERKRAVQVDPAHFKLLVGRYRFPDGPGMTISSEDSHLYLQMDGQVRLELFPYSVHAYFLRSLPVEVTFTGEPGQQAAGLILNQGGDMQEASRE